MYSQIHGFIPTIHLCRVHLDQITAKMPPPTYLCAAYHLNEINQSMILKHKMFVLLIPPL